MFDRRTFVAAVGAAGLRSLVASGEQPQSPPQSQTKPQPQPPTQPRKKIAIITTVWRYLSHAQHMGDRFLVGYPRQGRWHHPPLDVVSLYVDQRPEGDLSAKRAEEHGFQIYPTITEAIRCGGDELAVDGIVIIGEHGDYPVNAKGQILYPRFEFFQKCVRVFEKDGRAVPIFNDKHLSYSWQ